MTPDMLMMRAMLIIPTLLSLTVHEFAHAWSAWKLGDDTAAREGRLTLNPIVHIDPIGTILLPLFGIPFGWAKPVPVNPVRFHRKVTMGTGMAITAAAGPISNLLLAFVCAVLLGLAYRSGSSVVHDVRGISFLLGYGITLNVGLAIFNFLPLPPLDGSRILKRFIPRSMEDTWDTVERFGPFLLFAVIASGGFFLRGPIGAVTGWFEEIVYAIARG